VGRYEFIFSIVFLALSLAAFKHWLDYRQARRPEPAPEDDDRLRRLEERVEVLERIVTDEGYDLRRELARLED
jgi:hypothetical protein